MSDTDETVDHHAELIQALKNLPIPAKSTTATETKLIEAIAQAMDTAFRKDNVDLRAKNREVARENDDLKAKLAALEEKAKAWEPLVALGDPVELAMKLEAAEKAVQQVADLEAENTKQEAARLLGWNAKVLAGALKASDLTLSIADIDGVRIPQVKNGTDEVLALADYAQANWADDYLPALAVKQTSSAATGTTTTAAVTAPTAPPQNSGKRAPVTASGVKPPVSATAQIDQLAEQKRRTASYRL